MRLVQRSVKSHADHGLRLRWAHQNVEVLQRQQVDRRIYATGSVRGHLDPRECVTKCSDAESDRFVRKTAVHDIERYGGHALEVAARHACAVAEEACV